MADDILNMSLDDIIKKNAEKARQGKPKKPKAAGKDQQQQGGKVNKLGRVKQGGVGKKPQAGRVRGQPGAGVRSMGGSHCSTTCRVHQGVPSQGRQVRTALSVIRNDASKRDALEGGGKWKHDMFTQSGGGRAAAAPARGGNAKLCVGG